MSRHEKTAWFNLAVVGLALAAFVVLVPVLGWLRATGALGLLGLLGLSPAITLGRRANRVVVADERDGLIQSQAGLIAYSVFWLVFVGGSMGVWALYRSQGSIPVNVLPLFPMTGWIVLTLAHSLATVIQYQRGK